MVPHSEVEGASLPAAAAAEPPALESRTAVSCYAAPGLLLRSNDLSAKNLVMP